MTETNRIEYKRELTSELDIEKEVVRSFIKGGNILVLTKMEQLRAFVM